MTTPALREGILKILRAEFGDNDVGEQVNAAIADGILALVVEAEWDHDRENLVLRERLARIESADAERLECVVLRPLGLAPVGHPLEWDMYQRVFDHIITLRASRLRLAKALDRVSVRVRDHSWECALRESSSDHPCLCGLDDARAEAARIVREEG